MDVVFVLGELTGCWSSSHWNNILQDTIRSPYEHILKHILIVHKCQLKTKQTKSKILPIILKLASWLPPASLIPYFTIFSTNRQAESSRPNLRFGTLPISYSLLCYCCFFSQKIYTLHHDIFRLSYKKMACLPSELKYLVNLHNTYGIQ